jgi:MoaA/NifB/PqqE/SkfB family radical SAM enzyme
MVTYRLMEMYLFHTCVLRCGYCNLAEQGHVLETASLQRFKDRGYVAQVVHFFNSRTTDQEKWNLLLTGGDPLLMPHFDLFCDTLFARGNRVSLYTSLAFQRSHRWFQYLLAHPAPEVDYIMASFHPESEAEEEEYFARVHLLKRAGHCIILRFVGHPKRLRLLPRLLSRCRDLDVAFYPTTMFGPNYPQGYTAQERSLLRAFFTSYSQIAQLHGGLDTTATRCYAGSRVFAVHLRTGDITPCISVPHPVIGNLYEDRLASFERAIACPTRPGTCVCDVHFQQNIVVGADDQAAFAAIKNGFVAPLPLAEQEALVQASGLPFLPRQQHSTIEIGQVASDDILFFDREYVRLAYEKNYGKARRSLQVVSDPPAA